MLMSGIVRRRWVLEMENIKEIILVTCDTAHETKKLFKIAVAKLINKQECFIDNKQLRLSVLDKQTEIRFLNKYEISQPDKVGPQGEIPTTWLTSIEFVQELMRDGY